MLELIRTIPAIFAILMILGCTNISSTPKIIKNQCRYEITAENYNEIRPGCAGIIKAEHADEVIHLRNRDALLRAKALAVPFEDIALVALLNDKPEHYCLRIFGQPPSKLLEDSINIEDELLDCKDKKIPRVSISNIETISNGGYRVYIIFDCGLNGMCQSGWWIYIEEVEPGKLRVTNRELDWIT